MVLFFHGFLAVFMAYGLYKSVLLPSIEVQFPTRIAAIIGTFCLTAYALIALVEGVPSASEATGVMLVGHTFLYTGLVSLSVFVASFVATLREKSQEVHSFEIQKDKLQDRLAAANEEIATLSERVDRMASRFENTKDELSSNLKNVRSQISSEREFVTSLNYAIRTRMNNVLGMADMLFETNLNTIQLKYIEVLRSSGGELMTFVNNIYDYSMLQSGKITLQKEPTNIHALVDEVLNLLALAALEKKIKISHIVDPEIPEGLMVDGDRLRQVIVNLVSNAIKYSEGGEITLKAFVLSQELQTLDLKIAVTDQGMGMAPQSLVNLFEPISSDRSRMAQTMSGSSLGLPISSSLVEMMGGKLSATSKKGAGSTFQFNFKAEKTSRKPVVSKMKILKSNEKKILVLDTDVSELEYMVMVCNQAGFETEGCQKISQALEKIKGGAEYNAILMDSEIGNGTSLFQTIEKFRADGAGEEVPIVLVSQASPQELQAQGLSISMYQSAIPKPIDKTILISKVRKAISYGVPVQHQAKAATGPKLDTMLAKRLPLNILVAEDNKVNQMLIGSILDRLGYKATLVSDGKEAVKEAIDNPDYDLIFMDVVMPNMDGLEATKRLRKSPFNKKTVIVAMTANAMSGDKEECLQAGMDDYVAKPIRADGIAQLIEKWAEFIAEGDAAENLQSA